MYELTTETFQAATVGAPQLSPQEKLTIHNKILSNFEDTYLARNLSTKTLENDRRYYKGWFANFQVKDQEGERPLFIWEAMDPVAGPAIAQDYLNELSQVDEDDNRILVKAGTARAYAGKLDRLFDHTERCPYVEGTQTIQSLFGQIENPFRKVIYPTHVRDHLRDEKYFLTPRQILDLLTFIREVYPKLCRRRLTPARLYVVVVLITETGLRCVEVIGLDALGADRDLFYEKMILQTRFGKASSGSGPQLRLVDLTDLSRDTLQSYEVEVRVLFRNHHTEPALLLTNKGKRISYSTLRDRFELLVEYARQEGLDLPPNLSLHDLRASFATNYLEANPDKFWELMDALGHVSPSSTRLYCRSRRVAKRAMAMREARAGLARSGLAAPVFRVKGD